MDERLKYEQLIGGKLQSLPVPDMQDAIWARVKAQLDLDLPADDGDGGSSPSSPSGPKLIGWGLSVMILALVTTFFLLKNKPLTKDKNNNANTTEQTTTPAVQNNGPPLRNNDKIKNATTPGATGVKNFSQDVAGDSASGQDIGISIPPMDDSVQTNIQPPSVTMVVPQPVDSGARVKKGRGMTGLGDSTYRIVPRNKN